MRFKLAVICILFILSRIQAQATRFESSFKIKGLFVQQLVLEKEGHFLYVFEGPTVRDEISGNWVKHADTLLLFYADLAQNRSDTLVSNERRFQETFRQDQQLKEIRPKGFLMDKNGLIVVSSEGVKLTHQLNYRGKRKRYYLLKN